HLIKNLPSLLPKYSHVLPPEKYLERLISFYYKGHRSWRCHLPRLVISTFDDGVATPCPNIWFHESGNVMKDDWKQTLNQVNNTGFYELLLGERPRLDACKGCFTPWDTLSLYFEDEISIDELCRAPSYGMPVVRQLLIDKKNEYLHEKSNKARTANTI
ncbi:MAG: hypothetical protein OEZ58_23515, partial [Gammaproteobacteria bacterium]|nr:hypothetical protein [Gammaproteobacteria bacterium]